MTASGARATLPTSSSPLALAAIALAAIGLVLAGFVFGTTRVAPHQAAQPAAVAPVAVDDNAPDMAPPIYVGPAQAALPAPGSVLSVTHPVSESFTNQKLGSVVHFPVAVPWPMSRSASLHLCSPGTVIGDGMSVVAHGPSCVVTNKVAATGPSSAADGPPRRPGLPPNY